jgi:hypothetical protein
MKKLEAQIALRDKVKAGGIEPYAQAEFTGAIEGEYSHVRARDAYNGSLDAAKALHDAVLPQLYWNLAEWDGAWTAQIPISASKKYEATSEHSPARAWLLAILEALIAQEQDQ